LRHAPPVRKAGTHTHTHPPAHPLCDAFGDHLCTCLFGGRVVRHNLLRNDGSRVSHDLGFAAVAKEQRVPELCIPGERAAILDLTFLWPETQTRIYIDFTVYHPLSGRGLVTVRSKPSWHEARKHGRYRTRDAGGARLYADIEVWALAFSTLGGVGGEGAAAMRRMAAAAPRGVRDCAPLQRLALTVARRVGRTLAVLGSACIDECVNAR